MQIKPKRQKTFLLEKTLPEIGYFGSIFRYKLHAITIYLFIYFCNLLTMILLSNNCCFSYSFQDLEDIGILPLHIRLNLNKNDFKTLEYNVTKL